MLFFLKCISGAEHNNFAPELAGICFIVVEQGKIGYHFDMEEKRNVKCPFKL